MFEQAEDREEYKKLVDRAKNSQRALSPLGPIAEKDLTTFSKTLTREERSEASRLQSQWRTDYNRAIFRAVRDSAAHLKTLK